MLVSETMGPTQPLNLSKQISDLLEGDVLTSVTNGALRSFSEKVSATMNSDGWFSGILASLHNVVVMGSHMLGCLVPIFVGLLHRIKKGYHCVASTNGSTVTLMHGDNHGLIYNQPQEHMMLIPELKYVMQFPKKKDCRTTPSCSRFPFRVTLTAKDLVKSRQDSKPCYKGL